jgi:hypothetical protein
MGASEFLPNAFDWMRQQLNGFMRTQIIDAAATLSLAEHLQNGPRTVEEIAGITGIDIAITFSVRFLLSRHFFPKLPTRYGSWQWSLQRLRSTYRGAISFKESKPECRRQLPRWGQIYLTTMRITPKRLRFSKRQCKSIPRALRRRLDSASTRQKALWPWMLEAPPGRCSTA